MIRNHKEYRDSKEQLSELEAESKELSSVHHSAGRGGFGSDRCAADAADALGLHLSIRARLSASNTARSAGVG